MMLLMGWSPFPLPRQYENEPQWVAEKTIVTQHWSRCTQDGSRAVKAAKIQPGWCALSSTL
jgi:hypothetical protein